MSRIISRFSSSVVRSASSTCRSCDFATSVTTLAPLSRSAATSGSSAAFIPARRVAPNAASFALRRSSSSLARRKNSVSLGFAPGQPPSMYPDAEPVEVPRDRQLVGRGEVEPLLLGAVAQGGVVDVEGAVEVHLLLSLAGR